jgi:hypothetical protein
MEAIKSYLETMFLHLPNTAEVYKAKNELWQMMEDKYTKLKEEGASENEAVGTVIAEFGNLDELADVLGIKQYIRQTEVISSKILSFEEAKAYLNAYEKHAFLIALGVFFCIISVALPAAFDGSDFSAALMFIPIAIGVGLFVYSGNCISQNWNYLKQGSYATDFSTTEYIRGERQRFKNSYAIMLTVGVMLCILSLVPPIVIDSAELLLFLVAAGVFFIVMAAIRMGSYNYLLQLNGRDTIGGNYVPNQQGEVQYKSTTTTAIMSVYWPTVTCLYLIWSFLSFEWWHTWIIWPIASVVFALLKNLWRR